jgi:hypothetical protein
LDSALRRLNLGVPAWVDLSSGGEGVYWWDRGVGYTKLKDRWGIALRTREGNDAAPEDDSEELWPFSEAPRWMRIEAVGKLPDLLDALLKQTEDTTKKLNNKIAQACELADAIGRVTEESESTERPRPGAVSDLRSRLHAALKRLDHTYLIDALEHSDLSEKDGELIFTTPKMYVLFLKQPEFKAAVRDVAGKPIRITIVAGDAPQQAQANSSTPAEGEQK